VRNQIDQETVEQVDMIGPEMRGPCRYSSAIRPRGLGAAFGVAISNDLVEPRVSMWRLSIKPTQTRRSRGFPAI